MISTSEQFNAIIQNSHEQELISFLQSLSDRQKKEITPSIKKLAKDFSKYGQLANGSWGHVQGTNEQRDLLQLASFVCFNRTDYEKTPYRVWMLEKQKLSKVIGWYTPAWLSDFVNGLASDESLPYYLDYEWIMDLSETGSLNPGKELLVKIIPPLLFEQDENKKWNYRPGNLLKRDITIKEHIWYLFELESNLHYSDRFLHFADTESKKKDGWISTLKNFSDKNILDRTRLIKESLLASNRNFNKVLSGWFAQLFSELEPTNVELLNLQNELFSVLGSPDSKPVNTSLQAIKKIVSAEKFDSSGFLENIPVLLSSDTKSTVISTLSILEKLAQNYPGKCSRIVSLICQCFIQPDQEVQTRTAKMIAKLGDASDEELRNQIASFYPGMLTNARQLLKHIYSTKNKEEDIIAEEQPYIHQEIRPVLVEIPFPENFDDLVFLASQAFDNNEPWHIDLLPAALVQFRSQLNADTIPLFEPAFQRAFGLVKNNFRSTTGTLDFLLAIFFIDFGNWMIRNFADASDIIKKMYHRYDTDDGERKTSFLVSPSAGSYIADWDAGGEISFYTPYQLLLSAALAKLERNDDLPLLSTPTHFLSWISPEILADRIQLYQQAGQEPDEIDLQIAFSRVELHIDPYKLSEIKEKLSGEMLGIMTFLLEEKSLPQKPLRNKSAWMVASLTRKEKKKWPAFESFPWYKKSIKNYTGELYWKSEVENYTIDRYDYTLRKTVKEPASRKTLSLFKDDTKKEKPGIKKIISRIFQDTTEDDLMLYEYIISDTAYFSHNDVKRILSLIPNNPEPILAVIINKALKFPEFWSEDDRRIVIAACEILFEIWQEPGEMSYLLLATCMLSADKTVISIAGEIWMKAVNNRKIDAVKLGKIIGQQENIEFAPLKRFTDLVSQQLFHVSDLQNKQLLVLVENILSVLPDEPIRNLKKLLEQYRELLALNNSGIEPGYLLKKLNTWKETAGLRKTIQPMLDNSGL